MPASDRELLAAYAADGSPEAFAELVRRHAAPVYAACLRLLGDAHAAEDAAQATFLVLARKGRGLPRGTVPAGWLYLTARQAALAQRQRERRRRRREREAAEMRERLMRGRELSWEDVRPRLDAALAGLSGAQREVVLLRHVCGRSEEETAREMGWKRSRVSMTLSRAMGQLRRRLGAGGSLSTAALAAMIEGASAVPIPAGLVAAMSVSAAGTGAAAGGEAEGIAEGVMHMMVWSKVKLFAAAVLAAAAVAGGGILAVGALGAAEPALPASPESPRLKAAPVNTWVRLAEEEAGAREVPLFCYAPNVGKFILAGGVSRKPQHFDTELFDAGAEKWANAHPKDGPYKNESGLTDAPSSGYTGWPTAAFQTDKAGVTRIRMDGENAAYGTDTRLYFQHAFDPIGGKLYTYFFDVTAAYDPVERKWTDLKAGKFSKTGSFALMYGSLAYDPVNKEILSLGGTSEDPGGTPGTWAYSIAGNAWKRVEAGSKELRALGAEAEALRTRADALANAARNRFYVTESEGESKENLAERAGKLATEIEAFAGKLKAAKLSGMEEKAPPAAAGDAGELAVALKALGGKLGGKVGQEALAGAQAAQDLAWRAARALDAEPCGRGYAQMATDLASGRIVLFGGSRLDGFLADTWVYDCQSRSWEQRRPKLAPSPRAGHTLAWLPKSKAIILAGGASRRGAPPQDLWTYDPKTDVWKLLAQLKDGPAGGPGAADTADQLIVVSNDPKKHRARVTWGMRVDPAAAGVAVAGAPAPGTVAFGLAPADYDRVSQPDPDAVGKFLRELPANRWKLMPKPPKGTATRDWGTLPYDTDRHQILHWGGGHSTYIGTDLAHYSLRTATWSLGYPAEDPPTRGFYAMANRSFNNRPHVPNHVWDAAAYDPVAKKGVWCVRGGTWTYDPAKREWDYPPAPLPAAKAGELSVALAATPKGAVCWVSEALYLFDAKAGSWSKLPLTGGKIGGAYGDTSGICHDSKRDCLWLAHRGGPMMRYDMAGGALTVLDVKGAAGVFMRETVYVPEIDMLLNMVRVQGAGAAGNLAFDIEAGKWVGLDLPYEGKEQYISGRQYWATTGSRSLHYDPLFKVAIFYYGAEEIGALRTEKASLKTFDVPLQEPKKK